MLLLPSSFALTVIQHIICYSISVPIILERLPVINSVSQSALSGQECVTIQQLEEKIELMICLLLRNVALYCVFQSTLHPLPITIPVCVKKLPCLIAMSSAHTNLSDESMTSPLSTCKLWYQLTVSLLSLLDTIIIRLSAPNSHNGMLESVKSEQGSARSTRFSQQE